jgi:glycosyltransferase involved in cell wall biosynthesis
VQEDLNGPLILKMQTESNLYSVVIPVYNSEAIIESTVTQIGDFFSSQKLRYEIILVNDGSRDKSWSKLLEITRHRKHIVAINFLKNYGQHSAVYCGIRQSKGDYVITMDDDLQNPPEEIIHLINKINEGYDAVFARFRIKNHSLTRRLGSRVIGYLNGKIFNKPKELTLTNFRIFSRQVAIRMGEYRTLYPYIPGLILMFATNPANVYTEHHERKVGKSNYTLITIATLVGRLLFNYSSYPLKLLSGIGFLISSVSFLIGLFYLGKSLLLGSQVLGFTTLVVIMSFLNGFIIVMLGVMGEYISRMMNHLSSDISYHIKEIVSHE